MSTDTPTDEPRAPREETTTIRVSIAARDELFDRKEPTDTYDDVVCRLLDLN